MAAQPGPQLPAETPVELRGHEQYEVLRVLGRGGMGVVYLARNRLLDRPEVLKVVSQQLLGRPGTAERFLREIRSAARLNHPNIVTAYAALPLGELLLFAMEYVEGETLAQLVQAKGPLPVLHACYYAQQAARGLQHAFEKGLVHRDIKPQNLILARDGKKHVVKILDFGLAKATREKEKEGAELTGAGVLLGTPEYMAPEQMQDAAGADIRADIYSLGCTLYFLLTGRPPFRANSLYELLNAHQVKEATPLPQIRSEVPAELAAVVARMMAKDPAQRYRDPAEVAEALTAFVKAGLAAIPGGPTPAQIPTARGVRAPAEWNKEANKGCGGDSAARPPVLRETMVEGSATIGRVMNQGALGPAQPPAAKRTWPWLFGIGLAVLLLTGALGLWAAGVFQPEPNGDDPAQPPSNPGKGQPRPVWRADRASDYYLMGRKRLVHFGPAGPRVVLYFRDQGTSKIQVARVYDLATGRALTRPFLPLRINKVDADKVGADWMLGFSPDGKRLLTLGGNAARIWDAATGKELVRPLKHDNSVISATFSPDGKRLLTTGFEKAARLWDAVTGRSIFPPLVHDHVVYCATFSPDGRRILLVGGPRARLVDRATHKSVFLSPKGVRLMYYGAFSPDGKRVVITNNTGGGIRLKSHPGSAHIWDAATGRELTPALMHDDIVNEASFSANGKRVLTVGRTSFNSLQDRVRIWNAATGRLVGRPLEHDGLVSHAAFSPNGRFVVTSSRNKSRVWDVDTGHLHLPPLEHKEEVNWARFSPGGKYVVTTNGKTARLWDWKVGRVLKKVPISSD
jgi:WD40 repeat protein